MGADLPAEGTVLRARRALWRAPLGTTAGDLGRHLAAFATAATEAAVTAHAPDWRLPRVFAGHPVAPDVRADLVFTLALLADAGVATVAGTAIDEATARLLGEVDGPGTDTFGSYRLAEALGRRGPFAGNPLLDDLDDEQRRQVALACDSTGHLPLLDGHLPRNYAAVLARCEAARQALGLEPDPAVVEDLLARTRALLSRHPSGHLDDSEDGRGGRVDIYTVDVYLFCEPLRGHLEPAWSSGAASAAALVAEVATGDGAALAWGRSTGVLAQCHLVEVAALALEQGLPDGASGADAAARARWLGRAATAAAALADAVADDGLVRAHQHRSPYAYRGPARRLQMTFDVLGKLAWAAGRLLALDDAATLAAAPWGEALGRRRDVLLPLAGGPEAGGGAVWALRTHDLACTLALVGPARSDYLPAPQAPGLFEVPVDRPLAAWVPTVVAGPGTYAGGGVPVAAEHVAGGVRARWDGLVALAGAGEPLPAERHVEVRAEGRTLVLTEDLTFPRTPDGVALAVPEADGRPLAVSFEVDRPHAATVVDTSGIKEWHSFWGPLPRVHQVDIDPAPRLRCTTRVTPLLRVATEAGHHHYHQSLYGPLAGRVVPHRVAAHHLAEPDGGRRRLAHVDLFHLHWPEWFTGGDLDAARRFLDLLAACRVRLVWTQHNLVPHRDDPAHEELYAMVAAAADGVLHHSSWGMARARERYPYRADAVHRVVPHGHWGNLTAELEDPGRRAALRAEAEAELDLAPCRLRLGIVGAPRRAKATVAFAEAFAACDRDDLGLVVLSLDEGEAVPDDQRITGRPYAFVDRATYNRWLAAVDVLVLPFRADGEMLTTGVVADAVGAGVPALTTSWPFLAEALGDAALPMGDDPAQWVAALDALDPASVATGAAAARALRDVLAWDRVADQVLDALEAVGTARL